MTASSLDEFVLDLALDGSELAAVQRLQATLAARWPGASFAVRIADLWTQDTVRVFPHGQPLRVGIEHDRLVLSGAVLDRAGVRAASRASERLTVCDRWDSPYRDPGPGLAVPLAAGGELLGTIEVNLPAGVDGESVLDQSLPFAVVLAQWLRAGTLEREVTEVRDDQSHFLEHTSALISVIDDDWRIIGVNRALVVTSGIDRDQLLGSDFRELIAPEHRIDTIARFTASARGENQSAIETTLQTPRGRVQVTWTVTPMASAPGAALHRSGCIAMGTDCSRLHDLEQQVIRAERLATMGKLAAGVVHELNNPLTSITVYAEYLVRKLENQPAEAGDLEKLRRIAASANRILRFARELIQYARPTATEVDDVNINDLVVQAASICEHLFEHGEIQLEKDLHPGGLVVSAVRGQLEQVLINLVTNAAHAVEHHGTVRIRTRRRPVGVEIEVADTGPGVPATDRERIFEPFFTTKPDGKGTGLGLPIVRNIVEQHHGSVSVAESELGGASFVVTLPITS
jgi:PAS domain S-box-containing protein